MFKKIVGRKPGGGSQRDGSVAEDGSSVGAESQIPTPFEHQRSDSSEAKKNSGISAAAEEEAEAGQRAPAPPARSNHTPPRSPGVGPLASHPVTPEGSIGLEASPSASPPGSAAAAARVGGTAGGSPAPEPLQTHLRKVTASLVDILDQMSNHSAQTSPNPSTKDGSHPRSNTITARGDSVATIADLESQGAGAQGAADEMVPSHHVRRLTTTIVDMLRSMATATGVKDGERSVAAWDTSSELSLESDKLSVGASSSAATAPSAKDSEISAATELLKAQYLPQPDYRGDEVRPFFADRGEKSGHADGAHMEKVVAAEEAADYPLPEKLKKRRRINWVGLLVFLVFCTVFCGYVAIRATKTLGLDGSLWYGIVVMAVEIIGAVAMLPYGLCLTMRVEPDRAPDAAAAKGQPVAPTSIGYNVRVVIPCYKEPLDVITKTFMAAMYAALPANCRRTVYLLDDGKDPDKRRFVRSLGLSNAIYISGRKRAKGEMNGKSANINNAMRHIYPPGVPIPLDEVVCVFDADQVPNADFFTKTVPLMDGGRDVAMVLSPQTFYNLNPDADIFNHANVHFWDYTQPGYDALGLISCTGTNFLLRAKAFGDADWFPEWTLTEDFALGIQLKRKGWQCRYVDEYLAVGEAPEEVRNCFQQRSRWAKGHFQTFFSATHNPVLGPGASGLSLLMRWMYGSVILSYFSAFLGTPLLMLVPIITVWFGAFPIVINYWAALSITAYYGATLALNYYTRSPAHLKSMWFASVSNSILWFAFFKAMYRATVGRWLKGTIVFKVTAKGLQRLNNLPFRDVWMATLWFVFSFITLVFGLVHFFKGGVLDTPLAISLIFMIYNLIPQYLLLQYAVWHPRMFFNAICKLAMLFSTLLMITGVVLIWILYPKSYDYKAALGNSLYFMDTQRVGTLPADFKVTWRENSFLDDGSASVYLASNPNDTFLGFGDLEMGPWDPTPGSGSFGSGSFGNDPFSSFPPPSSYGNDPFGRRRLLQPQDPFAADAFASEDPFAESTPSSALPAAAATPDPFEDSQTISGAAPEDAFAGSGSLDPFAPSGSSGGGIAVPPEDPFSVPEDPFGLNGDGRFGSSGGDAPELVATEGAWDLSGGWLSGMAAGNMKATTPIAFTTALLAWGYIAFPSAYELAGQTAALRDSVRWGADYLSKVHRFDPATNTSLLVTRVGDVDTELMLWYRPEDGAARPAYVVDLNAPGLNGAPDGADLGGSVAAGLAAASVVFRGGNNPEDDAYAAALLEKAREVYAAAAAAEGRFTDSDFNMTLVYNSSTVYDDLAWGAGWLYKATQDEAYLGDLYEYYVKHMEAEGELSDWKFAFDWDNVFWPLNVLMAQETGKGTFKKQAEQFLRSWICANNAANYTQRGRAFNPMSGTLGDTSNAALLSLMYADLIESENSAAAKTYRCWALSQMRYMMGDAGRSMVVGVGTNPPKRTQDRSAACPPAPAVCNRVTGLLSPDPDYENLLGALVQGAGKSDDFQDVRNNDAARVGVENNAGFTGALAGASLLPDGMWEVCLQQFGIYRSNPVCGQFVAV